MSIHHDTDEEVAAAKQRHPSSWLISCIACDANGRGRFVPCAAHIALPMTRSYEGQATFGPATVTVYQRSLLDGELLGTWPLRNPRPASGGFQWGFTGHGPHLLAEAILADALGVRPNRYEVDDFCVAVLAAIDMGDDLLLRQVDVLSWLHDYRGHKGGGASAVNQGTWL